MELLLRGWVFFPLLQILSSSNIYLRTTSQMKRTPLCKVLMKEFIWLSNGSELVKESRDSTSKPKTSSFSRSQEFFPELAGNPITPSYPDILIAKLGPGQEIELEAHAVKGIGKTHAKLSPVATVWYRMLPEVILLDEFKDQLAEELVKVCPQNVFDIEDMGNVKMESTGSLPLDGLFTEAVKILEDKFERVIANVS